MLVDEYEQYQNNNNDRTDVVVVSRSGSEEPEPEPAADDRKNLHYPPSLPVTILHSFFPRAADPATEGSERPYTYYGCPALLGY